MKRTVQIVLTLVLLLGLCACGAKESAPTWQEQYDLGVRYLEDGDYEEAIIAFTAAIEIDPKRAEAYVGRGDAYVLSGDSRGNLRAARADYKEAIAIDTSIIEAYSMLSEVYLKLGEIEKAISILHEGFEVTGDPSLRTSEEELRLSYASVEISIDRQDITYTSELTGISTPLHYDLVTVKGDDPRINRINEAIQEDFGRFKIAGGAAAEDIDLYEIGVRHEWMYSYLNSETDMGPNFMPCEVSAEITCNGNGILSIRYMSHYIFDYYCEYGMTFDLLTGEQLSYAEHFSEDKSNIITKIRTQLQTIIDEEWAMGLDGIHAVLEEDFDISLLDFYIQDNELVVCSPRMFAGDGSVWTTAIPCGVYVDEW